MSGLSQMRGGGELRRKKAPNYSAPFRLEGFFKKRRISLKIAYLINPGKETSIDQSVCL